MLIILIIRFESSFAGIIEAMSLMSRGIEMVRSADVPCPPLTIDKYATPQMWQITVPNIPKITAT